MGVVPPSMKYNAVSVKEYQRLHKESVENFESFWASQALQLKWERAWSAAFSGSRWFVGGALDPYYNLVGKHLSTTLRDKPAVVVEWEDGSAEAVTYEDLHEASGRAARALREVGVGAGDWVAVIAPQSVEATVAILGALRAGAAVETIFTGFGWWEVMRRLKRRRPKAVVAFSELTRRGKRVDLLLPLSKALERLDYEPEVFVVGGSSRWRGFEELIKGPSVKESWIFSSESPLVGFHAGYEDDFRLVTHRAGGYLVQALAVTRWVGLRARDTVFCTVSLGWITGVSHCLIGALMLGSTIVFYNGAPDYPHWGRWLEIMDYYAVTVFLTTSTALRLLKGNVRAAGYELDALKAIVVTGEPLEAPLWQWAYEELGSGSSPMVESVPGRTGRIPVINTYVQTELGTFVSGNLVNSAFAPLLPGSAGLPLLGFYLDVVDGEGRPLRGEPGRLIVRTPWPALPAEVEWKGYYDTGDLAVMDREGYLSVLGRRDGVIKTSGYRISPGAIEAALEESGAAKRAVAFGVPDATRFEAVVVAAEGEPEHIRRAVRELVGPIAEPSLVIVEELRGEKRWLRQGLRERVARGR
ncbi:MAG: AMP-binding protein [Acidilobaceae archaeon]|nr:AMP-binding protein [Acidilobaceae archaeon]